MLYYKCGNVGTFCNSRNNSKLITAIWQYKYRCFLVTIEYNMRLEIKDFSQLLLKPGCKSLNCLLPTTAKQWDPSEKAVPWITLSSPSLPRGCVQVSRDLQVYESFLWVHRHGLKKKSLNEIKESPTAETFPSQVMRLTNSGLLCQRKIIVARHLTKWSLYSST